MSEENKYRIVVVLGTAREGRLSDRVSNAVMVELGKREDIKVQFVDVRDHIFGATINASTNDSRTQSWKEIVVSADGFFIITPEYNRSYPGELKMMLDSAFDEYLRKPAVICGVSDGPWGGVRAIEALRAYLSYLGIIVFRKALPVPNVDEQFDESGHPADDKFNGKVSDLTNDLITYINILKGRG